MAVEPKNVSALLGDEPGLHQIQGIGDGFVPEVLDTSIITDIVEVTDEDAIETLTLEDMDIYSTISKRIQTEDVFSLVDTYFMPYGVECDQYSILGEIMAVRMVTNEMTGEKIYVLTICCNELTFDVCINIIDLFGLERTIG